MLLITCIEIHITSYYAFDFKLQNIYKLQQHQQIHNSICHVFYYYFATTCFGSIFIFREPVVNLLKAINKIIIRFVIPVVFIVKIEWSVCICLTNTYTPICFNNKIVLQ